MNKPLRIFMLLLASAGAHAQDSFSSLEEQMTGREFTAAGLDKLTGEELATLNDWLRTHSVGTLTVARQPQQDLRGFENNVLESVDDSDIVSRLVGTFDGWDGNTVFTLENGQIWKQADSSSMKVPGTENPQVRIEQGVFNAWKLSVEGYGKRVRVERIQ